jgi:carboxypeptidase family protein
MARHLRLTLRGMRKSCLLVLSLFCCTGALFAQTQHSAAVAKSPTREASLTPKQKYEGVISGRVTDHQGKVQAGVPVSILGSDGRLVEKAVTEANGQFRLTNLPAGVYAAEVSLPSFVPYWKSSIEISKNSEVHLDINLLSIADSVEVGMPADLKTAADDWKWVLRASYPSRPILRFEPAEPQHTASLHDVREHALRGTVHILTGSGSSGFAQDPSLRTAFDMAYTPFGSQQIVLAGSAGFERGAPAAGMRGAWSRRSGDFGSSTLSVAVRQLYLPAEYWGSTDGLSPDHQGRRLQAVTFGYEEEKALTDRLRLQAGSLYDSVSFDDRTMRWSPFARLTYAPAATTRITFALTAANPRTLPNDGGEHQLVDHALDIPQISSDPSGHSVLEGGRHVEAQWEQQVSPKIRMQAAAFYDMLSHTALSLAFASSDEFVRNLLRDPFSNRYFLSGGASHSPGARVAVAARISRSSELILGYSYAGTLEMAATDLPVDDVAALRSLLRSQDESSFSVKLNSRIPETNTRVVTSYRWMPRNAVAVSDPYNRSLSQNEPYLNVYILQPIPSPDILPGQFEAVADFNNLMAQGYVPVRAASGAGGTLFAAPRSFRGGFNFIF